MPKAHRPMKLSPEEVAFLKHWIFDEARYRDGPGPAKLMQIAHRVAPAELAVLIAAAIPDPAEQEIASQKSPPGAPEWPWSEQSFRTRLAEARALLAQGRPMAATSAQST